MTRDITTIATGFSYLECPRWHEGRIWFVDFYTHRVLSAQADGSDQHVEVEVPQQPSGLGWLPDGRLLVVSMRDRKILRREPDGSWSPTRTWPSRPAATSTTWSSTRRVARTSATSAST